MNELDSDLSAIVGHQAERIKNLEKSNAKYLELLNLALDGDLDSRWEYYSGDCETLREHIKSELVNHEATL